jgi:hypothetical protein
MLSCHPIFWPRLKKEHIFGNLLHKTNRCPSCWWVWLMLAQSLDIAVPPLVTQTTKRISRWLSPTHPLAPPTHVLCLQTITFEKRKHDFMQGQLLKTSIRSPRCRKESKPLSRGHRPWPQAWGAGSGGGSRKYRMWDKNLVSITRTGWNKRNGKFIITVFKRGSRSMSRRLFRGWNMETKDGDLIIIDWIQSIEHARHQGTVT